MEHSVELDFRTGYGPNDVMEVVARWQDALVWCNHNVGEQGVSWDFKAETGILVKPPVFYFLTEEAATAFKLAWVGDN